MKPALVLAALMFFAPHSFAQNLPDSPKPSLKPLISLAAFGYSINMADVVQTKEFLDTPTYCAPTAPVCHPHVEYDPLIRPFAKLPAPAYYASQIIYVSGVTYISYRMRESRRKTERRFWWAPLAVQIALNIDGFVSSYYHQKN